MRTFSKSIKTPTHGHANTQPPGMHDGAQTVPGAELRRTLGANQPDGKRLEKRVKEGLETAIFLCEPPARINANSLILLPLFLVFSVPSISRFSPLASPPHCALISLFSYHAVLPAHIVFISFVYLVSHFLKGRACASQKSATSCFLSLPLSFSILASLACVFFFFMCHSRVVFLTDHIFAYLVNDNPPRF